MPEDAIIFQRVIDSISTVVLSCQPTSKSYYSQSQKRLDEQFQFEDNDPYNWVNTWTKFQLEILKFASASNFTVVTDIANYFDSIPLLQLRQTISSLAAFSEPLLDFLFFMLEESMWRPSYVSSTGVGLPQIDFDAPRLLAHAFLFEVDAFLKDQVGDNFARWMDDIDIGVSSVNEGRRVLGRLDELMRLKGIRLNTGKTRILDSKQAIRHFCGPENQRLTLLSNCVSCALDNGLSTALLRRSVQEKISQVVESRTAWKLVQGCQAIHKSFCSS